MKPQTLLELGQIKSHLIYLSAHITDQLSNFRIIPDYLKVVDFIEEMEDFLQTHPTV
jgi:hypothetical protein